MPLLKIYFGITVVDILLFCISIFMYFTRLLFSLYFFLFILFVICVCLFNYCIVLYLFCFYTLFYYSISCSTVLCGVFQGDKYTITCGMALYFMVINIQ